MTTKQIPSNHVVGVITGEVTAVSLIEELHSCGFDNTMLFQDEEVAEEIDPKGEHSTGLRKAVKAVQDHFTEELNYLAQYQEEARAGKEIIAVELKDPKQMDAVSDILQRHGARNVRFFGKLAVTDLSPDSNPTPRSEESPDHWDEK